MSAKDMILGEAWTLPREVSEVQGKDPGTYLQFNTHMVTFYQQTYGELSRFFLALRQGRLIGSECPKCKQVNVPAVTWHCPTCDFVEMKEIELPHRGVLAATAPITIFPSASFIGDAPFARGYVDVATDAPIASFLPSRLRTTTGLPRPGIFVKGVELKLVFEDQRMGSIRDIFWVPMSEVPARLRDRKPLLASQLNFARPRSPAVERNKAAQGAFRDALTAMRELSGKVKKSQRARKDLSGRAHSIGVKTGGGNFTIQVAAGGIRVGNGLPRKADFVMVAQDPGVFARWVADGSLTDAAVEGKLWLPHKEAFGVLPILDRLPRSVRRDLR
ncbi:MAG TPA: zinc ribbon domain-containing protein [Anaeromyxobacteraceae bacterium]|nr:zinc ribbon domain-containing protein [Anaeromyxobacteraceae bacterium]